MLDRPGFAVELVGIHERNLLFGESHRAVPATANVPFTTTDAPVAAVLIGGDGDSRASMPVVLKSICTGALS